MRETSRAYRTPPRPWPVRVVNQLWGLLGERAQVSLDAARWFEAADAPDAWDRTPFEVLAESLRTEAHLHPLGRLIVQARVLGHLRARRRVEAAGPDVSFEGRPPIVIVGLQRTGTTHLHRLLSAVPGHRGLRSFEVLEPLPRRGEQGHRRRVRSARLAASAVRYLAPDFQAVHPIEPEAPEEEVVLFEHVGLSTGFEGTLRVPSYAAWLEDQDQTPAYAYLRNVLAQLGHEGRWVLKTPHHLEFLPELWATFPGATLVWMHRDPSVTLPSFCSMVAHGCGLCSDRVDPHEIGRHWLRKTARMVERGLAFRAAHPDVPVLDVAYGDLVTDPVSTVRQILAATGEPASPELEQILHEQVRQTPQHRYGRHRYDIADFGLTRARIENAYGDYAKIRAIGSGAGSGTSDAAFPGWT